ncbi:MAG: asparagine synthase (glutamine-hydrolyzing) [Bryobacteraceae bacterium]|nr:asparagine synthase (glutamine-hydrolyzing) [Bryobacteraceae bacterium]
MCGIAGLFGAGFQPEQLFSMHAAMSHRGPDDAGFFHSECAQAHLAHNRLSILDRSAAGRQPFLSRDGRYALVFNGEIYNYLELRAAIDYPYRSHSDSEVLLAAYEQWGEACLDRLVGMFAFLIWDTRERILFAARDRFGVKPLYYSERHGRLWISSEIKALHAAGVEREADEEVWATYLHDGAHEHLGRTFWRGVVPLPPGHWLRWSGGRASTGCWYDLAERAGTDYDPRGDTEVIQEYAALVEESVRLRYRADVPVGINLSGGLDSSILLAMVRRIFGDRGATRAFTFVTGNPDYDEISWVRRMLQHTGYEVQECLLSAEETPLLAESVQKFQDEPFGGLPTLAYARLFERAREAGTIVLLDGQGMDEQWAGYDYYRQPDIGAQLRIQGSSQAPVRPGSLVPDFAAERLQWEPPSPFPDSLRNRQYRDIRFLKIPRALRFNDRVSMRSSTELREPFLDHRAVELSMRQPEDRKIRNGSGKWLLRQLASTLIPEGVAYAPKRPLQTPQREWLRGELAPWAEDRIEMMLRELGGIWFHPDSVRREWQSFRAGASDNSFFVWQWISLSMLLVRHDVRSEGKLEVKKYA